ncbi:MAG: hypothetical protein J6S67_09355 [Methanobrevibacter sp.]|nr:hypothetical protein [Methanobrevibacter sp.]
MLKINKQTITLTKGDDASLRLVPRYKDRTEYVLTEGDSAVFRIKFGHTLVELECTLNLETNKIVANITPNDTKDFNPGIYRYEAELITSFGFHYTFIADQTFILGQEYEQRITSTSNGNSSAVGGNLPEIDGIVDGEPVVYGDIQPTNPMMDYEELNHLPKLNGKTIKGDKDNEYYGIPTKTSDLENDSDFVSDDDYVHTDNNYDDTAKNAVDALGTASTYDVPESGNASNSQVVKGDDTRLTDNRNPNPHTHSKADIIDFPTNVSAFNNDSGFITNTVNNLANYYLKSETYTRAEVEQLIAAIKQGKFEIVAELPASGDTNVIYLVPKSTAQTSNSYDEYVYINNAWEKIGDTDIDLSGYVTDDELTTALQSYLTTSAFNTAIASYYTKTETDNLLANKVDKVAGKGLSTNDYDNTAKGIVDGVTSALNDKVDKVQGKGLSTNDYDNTAKGIVDGVTSALADKVDKVNGKGLSTEDYTTAEKSKLGDISDNAKKVASSSTNGHIEIDDVDTTVYDDTAVQTAIENIEDELSTDSATIEGNPLNFSTLSAQNAESTIIDLEPIQDLHGYDKPWVGGAGKNKCPGALYDTTIFTAQTDGSVIINGDTSSNRNYYFIASSVIKENAIVLPAGTYKGSYKILNGAFPSGLNGGYGLFYWVGESEERLNTQIALDKNLPSITSESTLYIIPFIYFTQNTGTLSNVKIGFMIESGSTASENWEPYENICPISGRSEIGILGCGKNLFDKNNIEVGAYNLDTGNKVTDANSKRTINPIIVKPNTTYYFSGTSNNAFRVFWYTEFEYIGTTVLYGDSQFTTSNNITKINIHCGTLDNFINTFQMEENNQSTQYTAYQQSNDLTISLGQTVYGGTLDVENGALVVDWKRVNLGDWTWHKHGTAHAFFASDVDDFKITKTVAPLNYATGLCDSYEYKQETDLPYIITMYYNSNTSAHPCFIWDDAKWSTMDETQFKTAMDGVYFAYILDDAHKTTITLTPNVISLLNGVNNISTTGDKITLTYRDGKVATLGDLTSAVDNLDSKIDESKILTDTATGDKYILVVTNGVLDIQQVSN